MAQENDTKFPVPVINLNGTDFIELFNGWFDVLKDLQAVEEKLGKLAPHGRDYMLISPAYFQAAQTAHLTQRNNLKQVVAYVERVAEGIHTQIEERVMAKPA